MSVYLIKKSVSKKLFDIFLYIFMILFSIIVLYPFWDTLIVSFSNPADATSLGLHLWIDEFRLDSYSYILSDKKVIYAYGNTIFRTVAGTFLSICVTMLCAYPLSKKDLPGRNIITIYFIFTMFFNGGLVPTYLLIRSMNLIDNRWVLILPVALNVYYMVIMRNYLMTIDKALEESAVIDGAGYMMILFRIVIPLAKPVIATVVLWTAVFHWNSWFDSLIYIRDEKKIVLQLLLRRMMQYTDADASSLEAFNRDQNVELATVSVRSAIVMITIGPIILLYPFLQKYFIKGIMVGSLKG